MSNQKDFSGDDGQRLGAGQTYADEDEISLLDLLLVVSENIKLLVAGPIVAGFLALGYSYTIAPEFTAKTTVIPPGGGGGGAAALLDQLGPLAGGISLGAGGPISAIMAYLNSEVLRDKVIEKFNLSSHYGVQAPAAARGVLQESTKVSYDKKSELLRIEVTDRSAKMAAELANYYVEAAKELMGLAASQRARVQRELLERQIEEALKKPYQSPFVRDAVIQGLIRQAEASRLEEARREGPFLTQVDIAKPPEHKSGPRRSQMAIFSALAVGVLLLAYVFARNALINASSDAVAAEKLSKIKRALKFKS